MNMINSYNPLVEFNWHIIDPTNGNVVYFIGKIAKKQSLIQQLQSLPPPLQFVYSFLYGDCLSPFRFVGKSFSISRGILF